VKEAHSLLHIPRCCAVSTAEAVDSLQPRVLRRTEPQAWLRITRARWSAWWTSATKWTKPSIQRGKQPLLGPLALGLILLIPYPRYVTEPCAILPVRHMEVRARVDGNLVEAHVDEGSRVRAGDVLARLENRELEASIHRARAEVDRLTALAAKMRAGTRAEELARAEARVEADTHKLKFAEAAATRQRVLAAKHLVPTEELERALFELADRRGELTLARAELRLLQAGFRPEEVDAVEADLRRSQLEQEDLERQQQLLTIVSPIDGVVVTPRFSEDMYKRFAAGSVVCEVSDLETARVEIYVPEREFDILQVGQPTKVKVQSFPLHAFTGKLKFVARAVETRDGERVLRAETEIPNIDGLLRQQMTGYGEIHTGNSCLGILALRRAVRWIRVRFLI